MLYGLQNWDGGSPRLIPSHTTRHAAPYQATREVEVKKDYVYEITQDFFQCCLH